jgi:cysteinyl-tRNA synthetase
MANYWMHNGFLQVEGEKMSKSLGNFVTIHELLHTEKFGGRKWPGEVLRLAMLRTHYRQPIDWTVKALEEAEKTLAKWYSLLDETAIDLSAKPDDSVLEALADDLNTPLAISHLHSIFWSSRGTEYEQGIAKRGWDIHEPDAASMAVATARVMGLLTSRPAEWKRSVVADARVDTEVVSSLVTKRLAARASKNWAESDRIRDELAAMGIALKDNKDGTTTWDVKR